MEEDDFSVPVCQGLIKPLTIMGISRNAMIINVAAGAAFVVAVRNPWMLPVFFLTHWLLYIACKKDPMVIDIFIKKYIKQKSYFFEG